MRLAIAVPERHVDEHVLNAGLETNTRVNESMLAAGEVPTFHEGLRQRGIKWKEEPPGDERFDHAKLVMGRGWGDCDDLAPWRAASMRHTGEDPGAEAVVRRSGPNRWHAIVQRSDGRFEDPSREAGMGKKVVGVAPAVCSPMFAPRASVVGGPALCRPGVAARPIGNSGWEARADVPWGDTNYALSSLNRAPVASQAIVGAIMGACMAAEGVHCAAPEHVAQLMGLAGLLDGHSPRAVASVVGDEATAQALGVAKLLQQSVGFSFGNVFKSLGNIASKAVQFVPGVGPIASSALDMAMKFIPDGKGGHTSVPLDHPTQGIPHAAAQPLQHDAAPVGLPTHGTPPTVSTLPKAPFFMSVPGGPLVLRF